MRILIVSATAMEAASLKSIVRSRCGHDVDVLVTGVGMVATAAWTSRALTQSRYDLAFNVGVCGSFDAGLRPGTVVHVVSDQISELGAEDDRTFLTIQHLGLLGPDEKPFSNGLLVNSTPPDNAALRKLPGVRGITVNTVHGNRESIAAVSERCNPQVESMEGAAFMYACLIHGLPFAQVRAVSNIVESRNRAAWRISEAIANLEKVATEILDHV
jgi:futalosine hydrolase